MVCNLKCNKSYNLQVSSIQFPKYCQKSTPFSTHQEHLKQGFLKPAPINDRVNYHPISINKAFIESETYGQPSTRHQGNGKPKNDFQTTENVVPVYLFDSTFFHPNGTIRAAYCNRKERFCRLEAGQKNKTMPLVEVLTNY